MNSNADTRANAFDALSFATDTMTVSIRPMKATVVVDSGTNDHIKCSLLQR